MVHSISGARSIRRSLFVAMRYYCEQFVAYGEERETSDEIKEFDSSCHEVHCSSQGLHGELSSYRVTSQGFPDKNAKRI